MPRDDTPARPRLPVEELRRRERERIEALRLREIIGRELDERGIADPTELAAVFGLSPTDADRLPRRNQWREGDLALLRAAAASPGLPS